MGISLRDLMKREKESRKRNLTDPADSNKDKIQKTSASDDHKTNYQDPSPPKEPINVYTINKTTEPVKLPDDFFDSPSQHTHTPATSVHDNVTTQESHTSSNQPEFKAPLPLHLNINREQKPKFNPEKFEEPGQLDVLEETYEILEDEPEQPDVDLKAEDRVKQPMESHNLEKSQNPDIFDETRLVYEQLNTAYCSNFEFEHEKILREAGIENSVSMYENLESDDDLEDNKNVVTSSNFGGVSISVSASENLPVGFFDDQNVDAKARGKLTAKEAKHKIKELSKKRSTYLKEAKYIQEKYMEGHREKMRMENDKLEHTEAFKHLQDKLNSIKGELTVDTNDLKLDPDRDVKVESILKQYEDLDYDELSWMSRSLV